MVSSTPRPHFTLGKDPVPILQEAGWAPGPVWTGGNSRPHRDSIPDRPARSSVTIPTELPGPYIRDACTKLNTNTQSYVQFTPSLHLSTLHFFPFKLHPTTLHYTCRHFTSSHLNFTQLHFTTLVNTSLLPI